MSSLLVTNFISPFVMLSVGLILKKWPASKIGSSYGYSTPASRYSQERWDYAQSIAPNIFIKYGLIILLIMFALTTFTIIFKFNISSCINMSYIFGFIGLGGAFITVEQKLIQQFGSYKK